ncbi:hypothetical protein ACVD6R_005937 [Pseudomonas aeruginosa]|jgi:hypothetical protein|uniref:Uncharacterized protein n=1 Tax=Ectopseudomonas mendocina TaxID=300 RepID=A0A514C8H5_ECTME|nr:MULTISPECIES: hypothetical protein [Pseudomonas]PNB58830.1 hypothetical protein C1X73_12450 [Pseudomonas sp. FW305-130]MBO2923730.1 hypothetical protein [Pseudomonas asiatica]MDP5724584.1 hypothetical protein [Pseudomonas aeruginosa]OTJ96103.1 hypothetical protein CAZ04_29235 [Pseudomonas aeruginosa]OTJ97871.1 hypothetical protein CAZ05_30320 [Pseudomonas aeruginosa]
MAKDPTTAREAMVAQMMEDFDAIVRRLEQVDADLAAKTSEAVRDAAGKVLLQTQLNFESMMEEQRNALVQAGREAAARIGNEINRSAANLVTAQAERRAVGYSVALLLIGAALGAAIVYVAYLVGR